MATSTTSTTLDINSIEWEVIDVNGFVYKRKKRRVDPTSFARPQDPERDDPAIELKQRRKNRHQALLKLKEKYRGELSQWEILSNTLNAMQNSAGSRQNQVIENLGEERELGNNSGSRFSGEVERSCGSVVDELRVQVEAQEAVIHKFEQLCDVADSICNAHEEKLNQQFFDLPVWNLNSPRELMASLCED